MQFHILSFEGPDPYSRAGGLAWLATVETAAAFKQRGWRPLLVARA